MALSNQSFYYLCGFFFISFIFFFECSLWWTCFYSLCEIYRLLSLSSNLIWSFPTSCESPPADCFFSLSLTFVSRTSVIRILRNASLTPLLGHLNLVLRFIFDFDVIQLNFNASQFLLSVERVPSLPNALVSGYLFEHRSGLSITLLF